MVNVLEEANEIIHGERAAEYGHPMINFAAIAAFWTDYIVAKYKVDLVLEPEDVSWLMALLKVARVATGQPNRDNIVDVAGYAGTAEMIRLKLEGTA
jgi:hypothetical protein